MSIFPYDDSYTRFKITGAKLRKIFEQVMRTENRNGEGENYQVNSKVKAVYSDGEHKLVSLKFNDAEVLPDQFYTFALQGYHLNNCADYLNVTREEFEEAGNWKVVSTSVQEILEEWLRNNQNVSRDLESRLVYC